MSAPSVRVGVPNLGSRHVRRSLRLGVTGADRQTVHNASALKPEASVVRRPSPRCPNFSVLDAHHLLTHPDRLDGISNMR